MSVFGRIQLLARHWTITVSPDPPCVDEVIVFTLSGVMDNGGTKRVFCTAKMAIPAVTPTYTWIITRPPPLTPLPGTGNVATVVAESPGQYAVTFTATATRECPPAPITIGPVSTIVPADYDFAEITYKTFIAPAAISTPAAFWLLDFYQGDGRWFGDGGASRTWQTGTVTVDPSILNGQVTTPVHVFGSTVGYDNSPAGSDVTPCPHCAGPYGDWCLVQGATPNCSAVAINGVNGNMLDIQHTRISNTEVKVDLTLAGLNPCESQFRVPGIDASLTIHFRQRCENGVLLPMEFRLFGTHDGFPWHELFVNGIPVYQHDPCLTGDTPNSLFPFIGDYAFETQDANHPILLPDGIPLNQWQVVPGLNP